VSLVRLVRLFTSTPPSRRHVPVSGLMLYQVQMIHAHVLQRQAISQAVMQGSFPRTVA
jgi:hypothetical protein